MIDEIKQLTDEELAEIAEVSYLHNFENAKLLLGHIGYLIGEVERLQEREFNHYPITILALESRIDGLQKALEDIAFGRVEGDYSDARQYAREALERSEQK